MAATRLCYGCMDFKPEGARICPHCGYVDDSPWDTNFIPPGTTLGDHYVVGQKIGSNSEGATYVGYNQSISCRVLIREYFPAGMCSRVKGKPVVSVNPQQVVQYKALMAEFTELYKHLAHLRGVPHICPTLDLFSCNNTTYAVYEYLEGIKLVDYLKDNAGELSWEKVSSLFPSFFTTLGILHNSGILHRAISPDTIYVTGNEELRLCAFCISSVRTVHTELPCEIFHGYAAPEQYNPSSRQGTWTDVYGISAVLYRVLTGCKPTEAPSRMQNDNLCEPHEMNPGIPRHVSRAIMQGMSLFSDDRIQTVTELVTALFDESQEEEEPKPIPVEPSRGAQRREAEAARRAAEEAAYDEPSSERVIDRIRVPLIIGVLLACVLLVIAIVVLNLMDMGPVTSPHSSSEILESIPATSENSNVVTDTGGEAPSGESTAPPVNDSEMPDLVGKNYETKKQQLEADGWLYLEATFEYDDKYKAGIITKQSIPKGTPFQSGETVQVTVSQGPSSIELPDYKGLTLEEYKAKLEELGLTNYNTEAVSNYGMKNGMVERLSKEAGEKFDLTGDETLKIYYVDNPPTEAYTNPPPAPETEPPSEAVTEPTAPPATTSAEPMTNPPLPNIFATEPPATEPPSEVNPGGVFESEVFF